MPEIRKKLILPRLKYYETHLSFINCLLPKHVKMTPMEITVLASFMSLEGELATNRFGPSARKAIREQLDISPAGLSNYIVSLTNKKFLSEVANMTIVYPLLVPENGEQTYMFKIQIAE